MSLSTTLPPAQAEGLARRLRRNALSRRDTLWLFAAAARC